MHGIATERSYVDLPIVGSGGSSVGGELVGWLHGVWPYNHSHNDVFFSLSLSISFTFPLAPHPLSLFGFSSRFIVTRSPRERFLSFSPTDHADNNSELSLSRLYYPNARQSLSTRSRCARGGRDTPVRVRYRLEATKQAHRRPITMASPPKRFIVIGVLSAHASMRTNHCFSSNGRLAAPAVVG